MWATVVVMAAAVMFEPMRIGLAALMLNRPQPQRQLTAFLCGGLTMGVGAGALTLFVFRATPLDSWRPSASAVQIAAGIVALMVAAMMATKLPWGRRTPDLTVPNRGVNALRINMIRTRDVLQGRSLWVAWLSGLTTALPSANFMGAVAVIMVSGEAAATQAQALLVFNLIAFTLVEIPLIGHLAAPRQTRRLMTALHLWMLTRTRRDAAALVAVGGCLMLGMGVMRA